MQNTLYSLGVIATLLTCGGCNGREGALAHYDSQSTRDAIKSDTTMIAVIFEVVPAEGKLQDYLDIAADLRPKLDSIEGFISIERFESIYQKGKILSLSFWKDERSLQKWRNIEAHRQAQQKGRAGIFKDYRLRVAHVVRDYGLSNREQAPADSKQYHSIGSRKP